MNGYPFNTRPFNAAGTASAITLVVAAWSSAARVDPADVFAGVAGVRRAAAADPFDGVTSSARS